MLSFIFFFVCVSLSDHNSPDETPEITENDSDHFTPPPHPTDEVIDRKSGGGIEFNAATYVGLAMVCFIMMLFLAWKFCVATASQQIEIRDDLNFGGNINDIEKPLDEDLQITIIAENSDDIQA